MRMLAPDIGSVVTSVKGPNMVYHSKENISRKEMEIWFITAKRTYLEKKWKYGSWKWKYGSWKWKYGLSQQRERI